MRDGNEAPTGHLAAARPLTADEIAREMRDEVARAGRPAALAALPDAPAPPVSAVGPVRLTDLLGLPDEAFVAAAYRALLGREPDEAGLAHQVAALASGATNRIEVLGRLRYSVEGRRVGRPVPGLRRRYLAQRAYRLPLLGRVLRVGTALVRMRRVMSQVDVLQRAVQEQHAHNQRQQDALTGLAQGVAELRRDAQRGLANLAAQQDRVEAARERIAALEAVAQHLADEAWAEPLLLLADRHEAQALRLEAVEEQTRALRDGAAAVLALGQAIESAKREQGWEETGPALAARMAAALRAQDGRVRRAETLAAASRDGLRDQERRLSLLLEEVRRRADQTVPSAALVFEEEQEHMLDPLYLAFEDRFRGARADIKERQRVYLPLLAEAGAGSAERPIVDVGSGRGEWLELLREGGHMARGVDLNRAMVETCLAGGLDCVQGDAVAYLSGLREGSLGAVTGFHIIEHLPFRVMVALLDASLRALASGGLIIFETPNPANVLVGSRYFYLDPTHRNPLPGEMVAMIAEARGFVQVAIRELHPMAASFEAKDTLLAAQLDRLFHGPQDYALIARKA